MKHYISFLVLVALLLVFCFSSCSFNDPENCNHEYGDWTTITKPTCLESGNKSRTCYKCYHTQTEKESPLGHTTKYGICGNCNEYIAILSGTYKNNGVFGFGATEFTFKGSKITVEMGGVEAEGTYKIKDDKITIEFADENEDEDSFANLFKHLNGEHSFEKGDDYIKIGG